MTTAISAAGLTRRYRDHTALDDINIAISGGTITGLLGRNGAGKTTLLRILAGHEFPSSGSVRVLGAPPAENEDVLRRLVFVREDQAYPDIKVGQALRAASWFYPNWDSALASSLLDDFGVRASKVVKKLSRGQRSALGITIGLAARAEVTLFDEPYAGLDAVARQVFYDRLLADFAEFPRTVLLSTHLIDEAAACSRVSSSLTRAGCPGRGGRRPARRRHPGERSLPRRGRARRGPAGVGAAAARLPGLRRHGRAAVSRRP
jgi:ABC-2 type transport system ATP-binding protein